MGDVLTMDEHHEILTDAIAATDPIGAEIAARKIDLHDAALRARIAELEAEVGRRMRELRAAIAEDDVHEALLRQVEAERYSAIAASPAKEEKP